MGDLLGAGGPGRKSVKSVGHNCFCGKGIPVSDGSGEEGVLSVQGSELLTMCQRDANQFQLAECSIIVITGRVFNNSNNNNNNGNL